MAEATPAAASEPPPTAAEISQRAFEQAWAIYPKRGGGNSKPLAWKAWSARLVKGTKEKPNPTLATPEQMLAGVERYGAYCVAIGRIGTEYVKQASTFFGPGMHFLEDWRPPKRPQSDRERTVDQTLDSWAREPVQAHGQ
jgi:hypothetical protein